MNRKQRKEQIKKIAQQQATETIIQKELDAMETSDVNKADGESPEAFAKRVALELMNALPMPGIDDPV